VEHSFYPHWQRAQRTIKQRNAALKAKAHPTEIHLWNTELIPAAEALNKLRHQYTDQLIPIFANLLTTLLGENNINLTYQAGWNQEQGLEQVLEADLPRDLQLGYTQHGPHHANLLIRCGKTPAQDILSQGQQKLTIYALRLAQGKLLKKLTDKTCVYLIDDLPAELDIQKRAQAAKVLTELNAQVFITGAEKNELTDLCKFKDTQLFHVEHGTISPT